MSFNQQRQITYLSKVNISQAQCSNASGYNEVHSVIYKQIDVNKEIKDNEELSKSRSNIERLKDVKAKFNKLKSTHGSILIDINL